MRVTSMILAALVLFMCVHASDSFAQLHLYVPGDMISGTPYEGMVLAEEPSIHPRTIHLASDGAPVGIPRTVTMEPGRNHAIFPVLPEADGTALIHAVTPEHTDTAEVAIHPGSYTPASVMLVHPDTGGTLRTSAHVMPMKVIIVDRSGVPAPVLSDTVIHLASSSGVTFGTAGAASLDVTVRPGGYGADFDAIIRGDGAMYALSDSLAADSIEIEHVPDDAAVRMAVTPVPAASHTVGDYFVWVERGGRLFIPDEEIGVALESGDPYHVRFDPRDGRSGSHAWIPAGGGIATGSVVFGEPGGPTPVTATVSGVGDATSLVRVEDPADAEPDMICLWTFPESPVDAGWLVAGLYRSGGHACADAYGTAAHPAPAPVRIDVSGMPPMLITGDGIMQPDAQHAAGYRSSAVRQFEGMEYGQHEVQVFANGTGMSRMTYETRPPADSLDTVRISPIPSLPGVHGDIAYLYMTRPTTGAVSEADGSADTGGAVVVQSGDAISDLAMGGAWTGGVTTITGAHSAGHDAELYGAVPGARSSGPARMGAPDMVSDIMVWVPGMVNTGSEFPMAIHETGMDGTPLSRIGAGDAAVSGDVVSMYGVAGYDALVRGMSHADGNVTVVVVSDGLHMADVPLHSFANVMSREVSAESPSGDMVRLGDMILLDVTTGAVGDPRISISGDLDFEWNEQTGMYEAVPEEPGVYRAVITMSKDGWDGYRSEMTWDVRHVVSVSFEAVSDDGVPLPVAMRAAPAGEESWSEIHNGMHAYLQAGVYDVGMPAEHVMSGRTYVLDGIMVNGSGMTAAGSSTHDISGDTVLHAAYARQISIEFAAYVDTADPWVEAKAAPEGTGMHRYGDVVTVTAAAVPELYGLIWHVPSEWSAEALPADARIGADTVTFEARDSVHGHVTYSRDYTMLIGAVAASAGLLVAVSRRIIPCSMRGIGDRIRGMPGRIR